MKQYLDGNFQWEMTYGMPPSLPCNANEHIQDNPIKWTLFAVCRHTGGIYRSKFSEVTKPVLSVHPSRVDDASCGFFAEHQIQEGDTITVYMGDLKDSRKDHDSEYALRLPHVLFNAQPEENEILLASHKDNDIIFLSDATTHKRKRKVCGVVPTNNAEFQGIYMKATQRILKGHEILVDYNYHNPNNVPKLK